MTPHSPSPWTGALAGYVASRAMDVATTAFYQQQSEESKRREQELAPGGTLVQLGRQLGRAVVGRGLADEAASRVGVAVHRSFGIGYGIAAAALTRRGMPPLVAGLTVGAAAFLVVDEGTSLPRLTAYPLVSHARGVVGHATLGLVLGLLLRATRAG